MNMKRKRYDAAFKARIALEALRGEHTIAQLAGRYGVHPNQISKWKKQALEGLPQLFSGKRKQVKKDSEELFNELYQQIGKQKVELDWLKKKSELFG